MRIVKAEPPTYQDPRKRSVPDSSQGDGAQGVKESFDSVLRKLSESENGDDRKFASSLRRVLDHEGTRYVSNDAGKGEGRYGILGSTARQFGYTGSMRDISAVQAVAIYRKLWDKSGAASLSDPLAAAHFDTFVNSPSAATRFLQQSGGDASEYLELREDRYRRLASTKPARFSKYLRGWLTRLASLRQAIFAEGRDKTHTG
jgi:hypothetical protein